MSVTSGSDTPARGAEEASRAVPAGVPHRAEGVELIGEMRGSGYRRPPALVRRRDGQVVQLTPLLYQVLSAVDGQRDHRAVADAVSAAIRRRVSADDVRTLLDGKLRALGLLRLADGSEPAPRKATPLLGLRLRCVISNPEVTRRVTAPFAALFAPVVVVLAVAAFLAISYWVLFEKGLAGAAYEALHEPSLLLLVFVATVVSAGFHEFGHAAAARYGGATPGAMGFGLYVAWPAFYTDVTDSYRLGRAGRLRTDLGGLYFNALVAIAMYVGWWFSGWDALLLVIATQLVQMARQLAPMVRFDGYHVLADLTGVPDLFHRIKPTLVGLLPHKWRSPEVTVLKPWARAVVTLWVLFVVPTLLFSAVMVVLTLPRIVGTAWHGVGQQWSAAGTAWDDGDLAMVLVRGLGMLAIAVPLLGTFFMVARMVRRTVAKNWKRTEGKPVRRGIAGLVGLAVLAGLAWAWWPADDNYRPIRPDERGAVQDVLPLASHTPRFDAGHEPVTSAVREGSTGAVRTVWPQERSKTLPTKEHPVMATVLVPAAGQPAAPTWVFPFDQPGPVRPGDNRAFAWNTTDGTVRYEVAFALVWVTDGDADNRNEAYALANCRACASVAIAFQVVVVIGHADVVPENVAVAVNSSCTGCLTFALASQLVVTLPDVPSEQVRAELERIWSGMGDLAARMRGMTAAQIQAELEEVKSEILDVLKPTMPTTSPTPTAVPPVRASVTVPPTPSVSAPVTTVPSTSAPGSSTGSPTGSPSTTNPPSSVEPTTTVSSTVESTSPTS
ncbi:hypothetical protein [Actinokineospora enzanensis]|uniref:hypothetical protein n=1 Tax=Actinokineospora enzanensis TaxID=155975 RepID=UPI000377B155|nr:hypothetical protein [Actinokineospora enzanensis]